MAPYTVILALGVFCGASCASPAAPTHIKRYAPSTIPPLWTRIGEATDLNAPLEFTLVLRPSDSKGLDARMENISANNLPWLTDDELAYYISPTVESKLAVLAAIKTIGASQISQSLHGNKLRVATTVGNAEKMFSAKFHQYKFRNSVVYRTHEYSIPASLAEHVSDVYPIASFQHASRPDSIGTTLTNLEASSLFRPSNGTTPLCNTNATTSACYRSLYGFDEYISTNYTTLTPLAAVINFQGNGFLARDLTRWLRQFRPDAQNYTVPLVTAKGANSSSYNNSGIEGTLDIQTMAGIVYPLPMAFYAIGEDGNGDQFLAAFETFLEKPNATRPTVISISWGSLEKYQTECQAKTMCDAAKYLSALGTTIVMSSGDHGVTCEGELKFQPQYPTGCPYILVVGATQNFAPEVMVNDFIGGFSSGAGFSNFFPTPNYQKSFVSAYLPSQSTEIGYFNANGRAYPDVAAQGSRQPVVQSGRISLVGGTSASAPIVAGGLALLNDLLIKAGKPVVGWANPHIYRHADAFTDVTSGGSFDCDSQGLYGLRAALGYDAPSGLGTPVFNKLRAIHGV